MLSEEVPVETKAAGEGDGGAEAAAERRVAQLQTDLIQERLHH